MRRALASERGNVVVTAVLLIGIMMSIGLAAMSRVDTQTEETRRERVRESSFNYAEAALSAQIFVLGRRGTGTATQPYPEVCPTSGSTFCADPAKIALNYDSATHRDFDPGAIEWTTWVRDNASSVSGSEDDTFWDDGLLVTRPRYDANGDRLMWVRAEATVRDRTRAMVGLIRIEDRPVDFPNYALLAGRFRTTNNGKHSDAIVNATGSLGIQVRCTTEQPYDSGNGCLEFEPDQGQLEPADLVDLGYAGDLNALTDDDRDALMDVARANGTYYTSCPGDLTGAVVVIDTTAQCTYQGNSVYNSPNKAGLLMLTNGKIELRGGANFYGLVYHMNLPCPEAGSSTAPDLVKVHGNAQVNGGVIVDCGGGIEAGSSGKQNLRYNANAFNNVTSFGTAGVVQNTWREIAPLAGV